MPELPEVETIRKDLKKKIIGKKIIGVKIVQKKSIRNSPGKFSKTLQNNYIKNIKRKGKLLIFELSDKNYLLIHLRMTGQLVYARQSAKCFMGYSGPTRNKDGTAARHIHFKEKTYNKHVRAILYFEDKSELYFNDIRRFGYLQIASEKEKNRITEKIGVDALSKNFNLGILKKLFKDKKRNLKSVLLDQKIIAGIGNIYADEICFGAKLDPRRKTDELDDNDLKRLYNSIKSVLKLAIKYRGTTFSDYVDASGRKGNFAKFLKVYGKEKESCANCKKKSIQKIKLAERTTRYCINCQK